MNYNKFIDHTLLKQDATPEQIIIDNNGIMQTI